MGAKGPGRSDAWARCRRAWAPTGSGAQAPWRPGPLAPRLSGAQTPGRPGVWVPRFLCALVFHARCLFSSLWPPGFSLCPPGFPFARLGLWGGTAVFFSPVAVVFCNLSRPGCFSPVIVVFSSVVVFLLCGCFSFPSGRLVCPCGCLFFPCGCGAKHSWRGVR